MPHSWKKVNVAFVRVCRFVNKPVTQGGKDAAISEKYQDISPRTSAVTHSLCIVLCGRRAGGALTYEEFFRRRRKGMEKKSGAEGQTLGAGVDRDRDTDRPVR